MKKIQIIGVVIVLVAVIAFIVSQGSSKQQVSTLDVTDTVGNYYTDWLKAGQPDVEPNRKTLAQSPILSKTLRDRLMSELKNPTLTVDPVICQTVAPEAFSTRSVFNDESKAQILVTSKDKQVTEQALFTLMSLDGGWYINDIECSSGESAPEKEFSFESEGFLLKNSIPAPYNSKNWHLVFEENGVQGNVVPLFFDKDSECSDLEGKKATCAPDQFTETTKVSIKGQMTEYGANVKRLELVKE